MKGLREIQIAGTWRESEWTKKKKDRRLSKSEAEKIFNNKSWHMLSDRKGGADGHEQKIR